MDNIKVLEHSSIRIDAGDIVYFDPFRIKEAAHDADIICITHPHYDHFSPEDIKKVANAGTILIAPVTAKEKIFSDTDFDEDRLEFLEAGDSIEIDDLTIEAVPAYNVGKQFHKKVYGWLGYLLYDGRTRYYIAGDTDDNDDIRKIKCDVALLPVGGTYTMNAKEAAGLAKVIGASENIPTHFGSIVGDADAGKEFYSYL